MDASEVKSCDEQMQYPWSVLRERGDKPPSRELSSVERSRKLGRLRGLTRPMRILICTSSRSTGNPAAHSCARRFFALGAGLSSDEMGRLAPRGAEEG